MFSLVLEQFLLIGSISLDTLLVSILYSYQKIKIPIKSIITINLICTLSLLVSFVFGGIIKVYIEKSMINLISFSILFTIGIVKLFDSFIKNMINKCISINKTKKFKLFNLNFIIQIYGDSTKADNDLSKNLSIKEAIALAISLSLDSLSVGIGFSLTNINYFFIIVLVFISGIILFYIGNFIGKCLPNKWDFDISWVSGIMLMILAFYKL